MPSICKTCLFCRLAATATILQWVVSQNVTVTTLAGHAQGRADGVGTSAQFYSPEGVAIGAGVTFVADTANNCIRQVRNDGTVSTLAGGAAAGHANGVGTSATLCGPTGIAFSGATDAIFFSDSCTNLVRKLDLPTLTVTTVAGGGGGVSTGRADGMGTTALFDYPSGLAVDSAGANLYIADMSNSLIRNVNCGSGVVSTIAGGAVTGSTNGIGTFAKFNLPHDVALDPAGATLFVADTSNCLIRKFVLSTGAVSTVAGGATCTYKNAVGTNALFSSPQGVAVDVGGALLFVADSGNNLLRQINLSSGAVTTLAGGGTDGGVAAGNANGVGTAATFKVMHSIVAGPGTGTVTVADAGNNAIRLAVTSAAASATASPSAAPASLSVSASPSESSPSESSPSESSSNAPAASAYSSTSTYATSPFPSLSGSAGAAMASSSSSSSSPLASSPVTEVSASTVVSAAASASAAATASPSLPIYSATRSSVQFTFTATIPAASNSSAGGGASADTAGAAAAVAAGLSSGVIAGVAVAALLASSIAVAALALYLQRARRRHVFGSKSSGSAARSTINPVGTAFTQRQQEPPALVGNKRVLAGPAPFEAAADMELATWTGGSVSPPSGSKGGGRQTFAPMASAASARGAGAGV